MSRNNVHAFLLVLLLMLLGVGIALERRKVMGTEFFPSSFTDSFRVGVEISVDPALTRVRIPLHVPSAQGGAKVLEETVRSAGLAAAVVETRGHRLLTWTGRKNEEKPLTLYYTVTLEPGSSDVVPPKSLLESLKPWGEVRVGKSARKALEKYLGTLKKKTDKQLQTELSRCVQRADCKGSDPFRRFRDSERQMAELFAGSLRFLGYPAVACTGFFVNGPKRGARMRYWVRALLTSEWTTVFLSSRAERTDSELLYWGFLSGAKDLTTSAKKQKSKPKRERWTRQFSVTPLEQYQWDEAYGDKTPETRAWTLLSLNTLPVSLQAMYRIMLLIPIAVLIVTVFRSLLGIKTFGTFMPVLISLSFRETGLAWGLGLLLLVLFSGLIVRSYLSTLHLLIVPRLSATLSVVILLVLLISRLSLEWNFDQGLAVTLFPIVILTMIIERMSISWEEVGAVQTLLLLGNSLVVAVGAYLVLDIRLVQYWVFAFPEATLLALAVMILCGRYMGYRLTELYRFREFRRT